MPVVVGSSTPSLSGSNSTITIQQVVDFARLNTKLAPIVGVGGIANEPSLSIANEVMQEVLSPAYAWKWNRYQMGSSTVDSTVPTIVTQQYKQDYLTAGALAFVIQNSTNAVAPNCGGVGIDLVSNNGITSTGGTTTVKTLEAHPFKVGQTVYITGTGSAYDANYSISTTGVFSGGYTITGVPTTTSFTFSTPAGASGTSGAPGITNFGWLESATMKWITATGNPQPIMTIQAVRMIDPTSETADPQRVAVIKDYGNGIIVVRCWPMAGNQCVALNLIYQGRAPLITALTQTWSPIPDELSYLYRQGFIAKAFRFTNDARANSEYMMFLQNVQRALGQSDAELDSLGISPDFSIFR